MREFLKQWYCEKGPSWCAVQLREPYENVKQIAHVMGLNYRLARQERIRKYLSENLIANGWKQATLDLGLSDGKVRQWAKNFGIAEPPDDRGSKPTELSEDQRKVILEMYPHDSSNIIAASMGLTNDIVIGFLQRSGKYVGAERRSDKAVDKSRFEWSNDFAYVLGYMYADGSVGEYPRSDSDGRRKRKLTTSSITSKDEHILWDIRERMGWKAKPFSFIKRKSKNSTELGKYWHIATSCRWVFNRLVKCGLKPRKSFDGMEIPNVPEKYLRHFVRGFFDGDGSRHRDSGYISFGCTDERFMVWLRDVVVGVVGGQIPKMSIADNATAFYSFVVCSDRADKLSDWMSPGDRDLRLHRKWA